MRKNVFIGVLAALMLFAFTACEQEPIDVNGYVPTMATIVQNSAIIEGQPITADLFTATVTFRNGKTDVVPVEIDETKKTVSVSLSNDVSADLTYEVISATSATVNNVTAKDLQKNGSGKTVSLNSGWTLTLSNGEASYTMTDVQAAGKYTVANKADVNTTATGAKVVDLVVTRVSDSNTIPTESTVTVNVVEDTPSTFVGYEFEYETTGVEGYWINKPISYSFTFLYSDEDDNIEKDDTATKALFSATPVAGKLFVTSYEADGNPATKETYSALPTSFGANAVVIKYIEVDHPERGEKEITIPAGQNYTVGLAKNSSSVANGNPVWATTATKAAAEAGTVSPDMINMYVEKATDTDTNATAVTSKTILSQSYQTSTWKGDVLVTYPDEINGETVSKIVSISLSTTDLK